MLYSEFLERTSLTDFVISIELYSSKIENIYMFLPDEIDKDDFCKQFKMLFKFYSESILSNIDDEIYEKLYPLNGFKKKINVNIINKTIKDMEMIFLI
jgi:hypothetical protein